MKKIFLIIALAVMMISCFLVASCKSTGSSAVSAGTHDCCASETSHVDVAGIFSDVSGKEWKLSEINLVNSFIIIDRDKLTQEGFGDIFTLNFDAEMVSGKGEPNRYSAPYTRDNQKINIMPMRSTLMASIVPNEVLNEHDFFKYLQSVHECRLVNGNLELLCKAEDGNEIRLVWVSSECCS